MSRRSAGLALVISGGIVAAIGLIGMFTSGNGGNGEARSTTTVQKIETTTTTSVATTTTEQVVTTTTNAATTTTTLDATAEIEAFVEEFAAAIEREDVNSLLATLHPAVLEAFDEEVCRSFIENEILLLADYRLIGEPDGPNRQTIGSFTLDMYTGPVAFTFQGQDFESDASFAFEEANVTWFTECRESG